MASSDQQSVQRADEREWLSFSPSSRFSFVCPGDGDTPEFFEERSGRGDGPPLHRHPWPTWELVLSGVITVVIGHVEQHVEAGGTIYTPAGAAHTYIVDSEEAHLVGIGLSGGRFHRLQSQAPPLLMAEGGPDMAAVGALAASLDVEVLGPPLNART